MKSSWNNFLVLLIRSAMCFGFHKSDLQTYPLTMYVTVPTPIITSLTSEEVLHTLAQLGKNWGKSMILGDNHQKHSTTEASESIGNLGSIATVIFDQKSESRTNSDFPKYSSYKSREYPLSTSRESSSLKFRAKDEQKLVPFTPRQDGNYVFPRDVASLSTTTENDNTPVFHSEEQKRLYELLKNPSLSSQNRQNQLYTRDRDDGRQLSNVVAGVTEAKHDAISFTPNPSIKSTKDPITTISSVLTTGGMEIVSTSLADRMALSRGRNREKPQLVFLADDPEAASRIPDLLTTLYDSNPTTRFKNGISHSGHTGTVTSATTQLEDEIYTGVPDTHFPETIIRDNEITREQRPSYRGVHPSDYFPPRYRPGSEKNPSGGYRPYSAGPALHGGFSKRFTNNMTRVTHIEAECQDEYMRINVLFNGSFEGLVYSSGYSHDIDCVYINGSGRPSYEFYIKLNRCGTLSSSEQRDINKPMQKSVMWNTLTVQYNPLIEEEWDEHFKVTCEYGLEIWKTVTFPFLDVEVQTGNPMMFTLTPPECYMEIRYGFDPDGKKVTSPVRVGDPLTLIIHMRSEYDGFDIVISDCFAHNGGSKRILLIDAYGCPVDDKLISHFDGQSLRDGIFETRVFAFMKTFRFTGSPALYIECGVRMCHGQCPTQLCHWRRSARGGKSRRSVPQDWVTPSPLEKPSEPKSNVTESLHLFQALHVIRDDDDDHIGSSAVVEGQDICFKNNHFSFIVGAVAGLLGVFASACFVLCLRIRRLGKGSYGPPTPQTPRENGYRSEFVPPKRRLE